MIQAGAKPINWAVLTSEWTPEINSPARSLLTEVLVDHGGKTSYAVQYLMAQVSAGLVPPPEAMAAEPVRWRQR